MPKRKKALSSAPTEGTYHAKYVFDGVLPPPAPRRGDITLRQHFFGQTVQTAEPVFDPSRATLMDFDVDQTARGLHFMYVLPFSPTQALVENTYVGKDCTVPPDEHRRQIAEYVRGRWHLCDYETLREEGGSLPMTTQRFPLRRGKRVFFIGTVAGGVKPSSGYAFARIGEHTRLLARAFAAGRLDTVPQQLAPRKFGFLDTVFLTALARRPAHFPAVFYTLFKRVPPTRLTRFLSETSTWQDDLLILGALPKARFLRAALHSLPLWMPGMPIRQTEKLP